MLPLFPYASVHFQTLMLVIALVSILWATALAFTTTDARLVVAYSSVAQLSFITLGIFSLRPDGAQGALLQMVNHALVTAPLFFIVAALAARAGGSENLRDMGGLAFRAPVLATLFLIVALACAGDAGLVELRRRVPDPARRVPVEARDRGDRVRRRHRRRRLRAADVHHRDAQPRRPAGRLPRDRPRRRGRAGAARRACILVLAFYPQFVLKRTEPTAKATRRPDARVVQVGVAMNFATTRPPRPRPHIAGPHIDWAALSPIVALAAGALVVLLVGLLRPRVHPRADRPAC